MLQQLAQHGFGGAHVYSLANGAKLTSAELARNDEWWLYYLCRKAWATACSDDIRNR
jgi:hypothetical protein